MTRALRLGGTYVNEIVNVLGVAVQFKEGVRESRNFLVKHISDLYFDDISAISVLNNLAHMYDEELNSELAFKYYKIAVDASDSFPPSHARASVILGYSQALSDLQRSQAASYTELAIRDFELLGLSDRVVAAKHSLALMKTDQGEFQTAMSLMCECVEHALQKKDIALLGHLYMSVTSILVEMGDYYNCETTGAFAEQLATRTEDSRLLTRIGLVKGESFQLMGNKALASENFRRAYSLISNGGYLNNGIAVYLGVRVVVSLFETERFEELAQLVSELEKIEIDDQNKNVCAYVRLAKAYLHYSKQEFRAVIECLRGQAPYLNRGRYAFLAVEAMCLESMAFSVLGNKEAAYTAMMEAYSISKRFRDHQSGALMAKRLADYVHAEGDTVKSAEYYKEALDCSLRLTTANAKTIRECRDRIECLLTLLSQASDLVFEN